MSRILAIQNSCFWNKRVCRRQKAAKRSSHARSFPIGKRDDSQKEKKYSGLSVIGFVLAGLIVLSAVAYLYQVNSLATKGYELKEIENKIQSSEKEINNLKIREVELKSMYNIEKATKDLNLVTSPEVSYIYLTGPVAMK